MTNNNNERLYCRQLYHKRLRKQSIYFTTIPKDVGCRKENSVNSSKKSLSSKKNHSSNSNCNEMIHPHLSNIPHKNSKKFFLFKK
jgi:hypothetical protein